MTTNSDIPGIEDDTRPNAGRVYDFFLGGNHNFEVDRAVARKLLDVYPVLPRILRMLRWFLGFSIRRMLDEGFTQFIDFASGLPIQDHIHQIAPTGTRVIYSDKDEVTVAYAKKIVADNPDVIYLQCEANHPEKLLNSGIVEKMFDRNKKVAIGMSGISYFLPNEDLIHALDTLYNWARKGDKLFISELSEKDLGEEKKEGKPRLSQDLFAQMGSPFYYRTKEEFISMVPKWNLLPPGCQRCDEWLNLENFLSTDDDKEIFGPFYGAFFEK
ncbi:MAG: SAM-dependent methyltransferase [Deltaproteobacteria bacterium]|nr:SAM-dependent methyltransferase [Deltaproteobacteria bacterium]